MFRLELLYQKRHYVKITEVNGHESKAVNIWSGAFDRYETDFSMAAVLLGYVFYNPTESIPTDRQLLCTGQEQNIQWEK